MATSAHPEKELYRPWSGVERGVILSRLALADELLRACHLCEWRCGVDRQAEKGGVCGLGAGVKVFKRYISFEEDVDLVPTLRIYLQGCNLHCRFCNTAPDHFAWSEETDVSGMDPTGLGDEVHGGAERQDVTLADVIPMYGPAIGSGIRSISLLGGEPTLHIGQILRLAAALPTSLPLVLNTNGFMTSEVIDLLEGVADTLFVDFKFGNDRCAFEIAGAVSYVDVISRNLAHIAGRFGLRVRHLLLPGHLKCCFEPVVDWLSKRMPGTRFQLMTGYVPHWRAIGQPDLGRINRCEETQAALRFLAGSTLDWSVDGDESGS